MENRPDHSDQWDQPPQTRSQNCVGFVVRTNPAALVEANPRRRRQNLISVKLGGNSKSKHLKSKMVRSWKKEAKDAVVMVAHTKRENRAEKM